MMVEVPHKLEDAVVQASLLDAIGYTRKDIANIKEYKKSNGKLPSNLKGDLANFKELLPHLEAVFEYYTGRKM